MNRPAPPPMDARARAEAHHHEWSQVLISLRDAKKAAARARATYKHMRARIILAAKADHPRISQAAAETLADAEDEVFEAHLDMLEAEGYAEALVYKHTQLKEYAKQLLTDRVDERTRDQLHGNGLYAP